MVSNHPPNRTILFKATHFNIYNDPTNPAPMMTEEFAQTRTRAEASWKRFEAAEGRLAGLDDAVQVRLVQHFATRRRSSTNDVLLESARIVKSLYEPCIAETEQCCRDLSDGIELLEKAALQEPDTIEGQAVLKIDMGVMRKCLATTLESLDVAKAQLAKARVTLNDV